MILITDISFFVEPLEVVNVHESPAIADELNRYIRQYEPELLQDILGMELYNTVQDAIHGYPIDDNLRRLLFGDSYTYNSHIKRWKGIIETDIDPYFFATTQAGYKRTFITSYIYFKWQKTHATFSTGTGEKVVSTANTISVSPATKMVNTWNEMSEWIMELWQYLDSNKTMFPDWYGIGYRQLRNYAKIPLF